MHSFDVQSNSMLVYLQSHFDQVIVAATRGSCQDNQEGFWIDCRFPAHILPQLRLYPAMIAQGHCTCCLLSLHTCWYASGL